jgi:anti-sigma-K factor RskA
MSDHDRFRDLVASYVLGGLSPADRVETEDHLRACSRCRDELVELAPLPGLLSTVALEDLETPSLLAPDKVVTGARAHLDRLRRSRQRWRLGAGTAAVIALVALGAALVGGRAGTDAPERDTIALVLESGSDVGGSIAVDERAWGTYVHVSLDGLPPRDRYRIWAVDISGFWHDAGSWRATPDDTARLGASVHLRLTEIDRVVVTSGDRSDPLLEAAPR